MSGSSRGREFRWVPKKQRHKGNHQEATRVGNHARNPRWGNQMSRGQQNAASPSPVSGLVTTGSSFPCKFLLFSPETLHFCHPSFAVSARRKGEYQHHLLPVFAAVVPVVVFIVSLSSFLRVGSVVYYFRCLLLPDDHPMPKLTMMILCCRCLLVA